MQAAGTTIKQPVLTKVQKYRVPPPLLYLTDKRRLDVPPALCRTPHVREVWQSMTGAIETIAGIKTLRKYSKN